MKALSPLSPEMMVKAIESADDGIYVTDREGTILFANQAVLDIVGSSQEELVGCKTSVFQSGRMSPEYYTRLWATVLSGKVWREVIVNRRANGELYEASQTITPVRDGRGDVAFMIAVQRDISRQKELEQELSRTHSEVEKLLDENKTLMRELRHRVKNDIEMVRALLELQADETTSGEAKAELGRAADRVGALARSYRVLHEHATSKTVQLTALIGAFAENWRSIRPTMKVEIRTADAELSPRRSVSVGIIANELVTNAAKHAGTGDLTVTVDAWIDDGSLVLTVTDTGAGYPESVLAETERGFGLRLIEALADQHGASVRLSNQGGAVAEVLFPAGSY